MANYKIFFWIPPETGLWTQSVKLPNVKKKSGEAQRLPTLLGQTPKVAPIGLKFSAVLLLPLFI
jgi:hypothetical protein